MQGIQTIIVKDPNSFVNFKGGGGVGTPVPLSGSVHGSIRSVKLL